MGPLHPRPVGFQPTLAAECDRPAAPLRADSSAPLVIVLLSGRRSSSIVTECVLPCHSRTGIVPVWLHWRSAPAVDMTPRIKRSPAALPARRSKGFSCCPAESTDLCPALNKVAALERMNGEVHDQMEKNMPSTISHVESLSALLAAFRSDKRLLPSAIFFQTAKSLHENIPVAIRPTPSTGDRARGAVLRVRRGCPRSDPPK